MPPHHPDSIYIEVQREVKRKKGFEPASRLLTPRDELIEHYQLLYEMSPENSKSDDSSRVRQTVMDKVPEFARRPVESLSPTLISIMVLNKVHQGEYLIVRAISRAVRLMAVQFLVEDQEGTVVDLALYNCLETSGLDRRGILELVPVGQALLIREPWLTRGRTGGHVTIRVDSPTDITFLPLERCMRDDRMGWIFRETKQSRKKYIVPGAYPLSPPTPPPTPPPNHPLLEQSEELEWRIGSAKGAEFYKEIGNKAFKNGRFESAIRAYSNGLSLDPAASLLRLNRSVCYLNINQPSLAIQDARVASEDEALTDTLRSKARYRTAQAYYRLDRFKDALSILGDKNRTQFSPKDFSELEKKSRQRLVEQEQGNYDWFALNNITDQINGHRSIPEVADYVGPVKVAQMSTIGGGRGLVTTRNVFAGELLLVSKPFAFASSVEYPELCRIFHTRSGKSLERANFELVGRAIQRLRGDHTAASALFMDLYSNTTGAKDSPVGNRLPSFLTTGGRYWDTPGEFPIGDIDVNRVEEILFDNSFSTGVPKSSFGMSEAIYLLPSMVNHSCHGTAIRTFAGPIMVMRASRDLKAGEEITCSYVGAEQVGTFISRNTTLKKWHIVCRCELCLADQEDGESHCRDRERYEEELDKLRTNINSGDLEQAKIAKELVTKIRLTYKDRGTTPMDTLGVAQRYQAFAQYTGDPNPVIALYVDAIRSHGIHVKDKPPKKVPQNRSQLHRESLIIGTRNFPSQPGVTFLCIQMMATMVVLEVQRGKIFVANHWAVACLWVHEAFFGPGKRFLWHTLNIQGGTEEPMVMLLKGFE